MCFVCMTIHAHGKKPRVETPWGDEVAPSGKTLIKADCVCECVWGCACVCVCCVMPQGHVQMLFE